MHTTLATTLPRLCPDCKCELDPHETRLCDECRMDREDRVTDERVFGESFSEMDD